MAALLIIISYTYGMLAMVAVMNHSFVPAGSGTRDRHEMRDVEMDAIDVLSWLLAGLASGVLMGSINPDSSRGARFAIAGVGAVDALLGGAVAADIFNVSAVAFLGAVCAGVAGTALQCALLWRRPFTRYHR